MELTLLMQSSKEEYYKGVKCATCFLQGGQGHSCAQT